MMYLLDTANIEQIERVISIYPIEGITTNPTIISKENMDFVELINKIKTIIGDRMFHIQVTSNTYEEIIEEAKALKKLVGENLYVKIPISPDGLKATMELKKMGFKITETAIFTQQQALIAAKAGADFVAPYINRLDNVINDGTFIVKEIVELFKVHNINCKVLAASFKNAEQVHKVSLVGGNAVTISPDILEMLVNHPLTNTALDIFKDDWKKVYGDKNITELCK